MPDYGSLFGNDHYERTNGVTYRWERSDGTVGPTQSVHVSGTIEVKDSWANEGLTYKSGQTSDWEVIHVLSPTDLRSQQAVVQIQCAPGIDISNTPDPPNQQLHNDFDSKGGGCGDRAISFNFLVESNRPTQITYHFEHGGQVYDASGNLIQAIATATTPSVISSPWFNSRVGKYVFNGTSDSAATLKSGFGPTVTNFTSTLVITSPYKLSSAKSTLSWSCD